MSLAVAETRSGRLRGRDAEGVRSFLGIPFAAPPTGARRFRPPRPVEAWAGVRDAQRFGSPAPQAPGMISTLLGLRGEQTAEDCLTLNVWTPGPDAGRRPVLVWIHGGSFTSGSGGMAVYDGSALARRGDVVVVTLNYRLGALGFLAHPDFVAEDEGSLGNLGILDQIAALEWVQGHADVFGGDAGNVTLFGESAGAMSVATLLAIPRARRLFHRAILQSGGADNVSTREQADRVFVHFVKELGLSPHESGRRLRELPVADLLAAQQRTVAALWREVSGLPFQPVVDGDLLVEPPIAAVADGAASHIPLLLGTNRDEYKLWSPTDPKAASLDDAALRRRMERLLPGHDARGVAWADRVVDVYRTAREGRRPVLAPELWFAIETDRLLRDPLLHLAERHANHQRDTWVYLFTWESPAWRERWGAATRSRSRSCSGRSIIPPCARSPGRERRPRACPGSSRTPGWPLHGRAAPVTRVFPTGDPTSGHGARPSSWEGSARSWTHPTRRSAASGTRSVSPGASADLPAHPLTSRRIR